MPKYRVSAAVTISVWTEVEAESEEQAKATAEDRPMQRLCHQCADGRGSRSMWRTSGDLDGSPHELTVELE